MNKIKESNTKKIFKLICKCGKPYEVFVTEYQYRKSNYRKHCSRSCAMIYSYGSHNELTRRKISIAVREKFSTFSKEKKRQMTKKATEKLREKMRKVNQHLLFNLWDDLPLSLKRKRVLMEQDYKCFSCGITEWNGKPITFHFDHIDGDSKNDSRENVRFLCPNCHSQTKTYCGNKQNLSQFEYLKTKKDGAVAQLVEQQIDNLEI